MGVVVSVLAPFAQSLHFIDSTCGQVRSLVLSFYVSLWHSVLVCYQCVEIFGQTSSKYLWVGFRLMGVGLALGLRLVLHMIDMMKAPHKYLDV